MDILQFVRRKGWSCTEVNNVKSWLCKRKVAGSRWVVHKFSLPDFIVWFSSDFIPICIPITPERARKRELGEAAGGFIVSYSRAGWPSVMSPIYCLGEILSYFINRFIMAWYCLRGGSQTMMGTIGNARADSVRDLAPRCARNLISFCCLFDSFWPSRPPQVVIVTLAFVKSVVELEAFPVAWRPIEEVGKSSKIHATSWNFILYRDRT